MGLVRFVAAGFQSYGPRQTLRLAEGPTLLAGRNNAGKSALLRAIRYPVQEEPGGTSDLFLEYEWTLSAQDVRKISPDLAAHDALLRYIEREGESVLVAQIGRAGGGASTGASSQPQPIDKGVRDRLEYRDIRLAVGGRDVVHINLRSRKEERPARLYLWWPDDEEWSEERQQLATGAREAAQTLIHRQYLISPRRSTEPMTSSTTTVLASDGTNLTAVVGTLYRNYRHDLLEELEAFISDVFPEVEHVDVPGTGSPPTEEIVLVLRRKGGLRVPLKYSGTGIEQALMLGTAVLTAPTPGYLFLIDEPHAFLHPWAERRIIRFIRAHPEHQYVIATHSPAFLTAYPVDHARLVVMAEAGTEIGDAGAHSAILAELGFTAADLWSTDAILWMEGSSDVAIAKAVVESVFPDDTFSVRHMPDPLRSAARKKSDAKAAHALCVAIAEAVLPIHVRMTFLYDGDERPEEIKNQVRDVTEGRARFLAVREVENCLLSPAALFADLAAQCELLGLAKPTATEVQAELDAILNEFGSTELYPGGTKGPDLSRVVGSAVLRRLYMKWTISEYDKVRDGERLVRKVAELDRTRLEPLLSILRELVGTPASGSRK